MIEGSKERPVELSIETGPHAGVRRRLAFGVMALGSGLESDIVFADESMAFSHAAVDLSPEGVSVQALKADLTLPGNRGVVRSGESKELTWPAHFTLGRTRLRFDLPSEVRGHKRSPLSTIWPAIGGAAVLVAAVLLGSQYLSAFSSNEMSANRATLRDTSDLKTLAAPKATTLDGKTMPKSSPPRQATDIAIRAMNDLERQINASGIDWLDVNEEDGAVIVSGVLDDDSHTRWQDVEMWFDQRYGTSVPLDSRLSIDEADKAPDIVIRAVWSGASPYLVAGDGQRYTIGSAIPGGWMLDAIRPNAVVFRQNRRTFQFELEG